MKQKLKEYWETTKLWATLLVLLILFSMLSTPEMYQGKLGF